MKTAVLFFIFTLALIPCTASDLLAADFGDLLNILKPGSGSSDSSSVSGSAGTRGIDEDEGYTRNAPPDFQSVSWVEQFTVNDAIIHSFLKNGGLRTNIVLPKKVDTSKEGAAK